MPKHEYNPPEDNTPLNNAFNTGSMEELKKQLEERENQAEGTNEAVQLEKDNSLFHGISNEEVAAIIQEELGPKMEEILRQSFESKQKKSPLRFLSKEDREKISAEIREDLGKRLNGVFTHRNEPEKSEDKTTKELAIQTEESAAKSKEKLTSDQMHAMRVRGGVIGNERSQGRGYKNARGEWIFNEDAEKEDANTEDIMTRAQRENEEFDRPRITGSGNTDSEVADEADEILPPEDKEERGNLQLEGSPVDLEKVGNNGELKKEPDTIPDGKRVQKVEKSLERHKDKGSGADTIREGKRLEVPVLERQLVLGEKLGDDRKGEKKAWFRNAWTKSSEALKNFKDSKYAPYTKMVKDVVTSNLGVKFFLDVIPFINQRRQVHKIGSSVAEITALYKNRKNHHESRENQEHRAEILRKALTQGENTQWLLTTPEAGGEESDVTTALVKLSQNLETTAPNSHEGSRRELRDAIKIFNERLKSAEGGERMRHEKGTKRETTEARRVMRKLLTEMRNGELRDEQEVLQEYANVKYGFIDSKIKANVLAREALNSLLVGGAGVTGGLALAGARTAGYGVFDAVGRAQGKRKEAFRKGYEASKAENKELAQLEKRKNELVGPDKERYDELTSAKNDRMLYERKDYIEKGGGAGVTQFFKGMYTDTVNDLNGVDAQGNEKTFMRGHIDRARAMGNLGRYALMAVNITGARGELDIDEFLGHFGKLESFSPGKVVHNFTGNAAQTLDRLTHLPQNLGRAGSHLKGRVENLIGGAGGEISSAGNNLIPDRQSARPITQSPETKDFNKSGYFQRQEIVPTNRHAIGKRGVEGTLIDELTKDGKMTGPQAGKEAHKIWQHAAKELLENKEFRTKMQTDGYELTEGKTKSDQTKDMEILERRMRHLKIGSTFEYNPTSGKITLHDELVGKGKAGSKASVLEEHQPRKHKRTELLHAKPRPTNVPGYMSDEDLVRKNEATIQRVNALNQADVEIARVKAQQAEQQHWNNELLAIEQRKTNQTRNFLQLGFDTGDIEKLSQDRINVRDVVEAFPLKNKLTFSRQSEWPPEMNHLRISNPRQFKRFQNLAAVLNTSLQGTNPQDGFRWRSGSVNELLSSIDERGQLMPRTGTEIFQQQQSPRPQQELRPRNEGYPVSSDQSMRGGQSPEIGPRQNSLVPESFSDRAYGIEVNMFRNKDGLLNLQVTAPHNRETNALYYGNFRRDWEPQMQRRYPNPQEFELKKADLSNRVGELAKRQYVLRHMPPSTPARTREIIENDTLILHDTINKYFGNVIR